MERRGHNDIFYLLSAHGLVEGRLRADLNQLLRQKIRRDNLRRLRLGRSLRLQARLKLGHCEELGVRRDGLLVGPRSTVLYLLGQVGIADEHHRFKMLLVALFGVLERFLKFLLGFVRRGGLVVVARFFHRDVHVVSVTAS